MKSVLIGDELWAELERHSAKSKSITIAVAYVGRHPVPLLKWPKTVRLFADLTELTVSRGASSALGALELLKATKARIFQIRRIHEKIYLFDDSAIVCSANLSEHSRYVLREAGVLLTDKRSVQSIRSHLTALEADGETAEMDETLLEARAKSEPANGGWGGGGWQPRSSARLWLVPCWPYNPSAKEQQVRARKKKEIRVSRQLLQRARIDEYLCSRMYSMKDGDDVVFLWRPTSRRPYGFLEGPSGVVQMVNLGTTLPKNKRYVLFHRGKPRPARVLSRSEYRKLVAMLGDARKLKETLGQLDETPLLLEQPQRQKVLDMLGMGD